MSVSSVVGSFERFEAIGQFFEVLVLRDLSADVDRVGQRSDPLDADLLVFGVVDPSVLDFVAGLVDRLVEVLCNIEINGTV